MQEKSIKFLDRQIQRIQIRLAKLGPLRPGTLSRQYRQPDLQKGAYYQLSYTYRMKSHTEYVPRDQVRIVRQEIAAYQRYKRLTAQWIDLALQRSRLRMQLARSTASQSNPAKEGSRPNLGHPKLKNP